MMILHMKSVSYVSEDHASLMISVLFYIPFYRGSSQVSGAVAKPHFHTDTALLLALAAYSGTVDCLH
jgi:hypothetical protein